jgi:hypothetical protein
MALLDFVLDHTGAIGAKIRSAQLKVKREQVIMQRPPQQKRTVIVTSEGKRLVFDAITDITHSFPTKVTSYPVEDRSNISDHVVNGNPTFSISGVFSDASIQKGREHKFNQNETYEQLMKVRDERKVVTLISHLSTYTDLVLTGVSVKRSTGQGLALYVDLTFEKIRRVSNEVTTVFVSTTGASKTKVPSTSGDTKIKNAANVDDSDKLKDLKGNPLFQVPDIQVSEPTNPITGAYKFLDSNVTKLFTGEDVGVIQSLLKNAPEKVYTVTTK